MKRWLLLAGHVPADLRGGGINRYTVELARALARRDDIDVHVTATPDAAGALGELIDRPENVVTMPAMPGALSPFYERFVMGRRLARDFDVVHGVKHLLPLAVRARTVLTVHDMLLYDRPQDYPTAKRFLLRRPYRGSLRQADVLVCVSQATRRRLVHHLESARSRATVVLSASGSALMDAVDVPVGELEGRRFALVVGDPSPRKNLSTVTSAWSRVVRDHPDALLVLVGPPAWGAASYGQDHEHLVAQGNVRQMVGVDDGTLRWLYRNAIVVLSPSLSEGFGLPALEALDLGAPLITSDDPALVEVSGGSAAHLPALDVQAWADAAAARLTAGRRPQPSRAVRTWDDVAGELVDQVLGDVQLTGR